MRIARIAVPRTSDVARGLPLCVSTLICVALGTMYAQGRDIGLPGYEAPQEVEAEIKRMVRASQEYEYFTVYTDPGAFEKTKLLKYWAPAELGGKELLKIETSVNRLVVKGWRYGRESKINRFDFRYVRLLSPGNAAVAATTETWFLPIYDRTGIRVMERTPTLGPYPIEYALRRVGNTWLIIDSSTPRATK